MRRKPLVLQERPDLKEMTFQQVKELARALCGKTNRQISEEMGLGVETVRRYFTDPGYHPTVPNIPDLCRSLGNMLIIEWQAVQVGGHLVVVEAEPDRAGVERCISDVLRESSDVLREQARALEDGMYSIDELRRLRKELQELVKEAQEAVMLIDRKIRKKGGEVDDR